MLCRGLQLERQTADFLVAGLLEGMPFHLSDPVVMSTIAGTCSAMVVSFSMDRASANLAALRYFWQRLIDPQMPTSIFPHAEPCCAHGVALVKTRPRQGKQIVAVAHTFTSSMRQWKFVDALREQMISLVTSSLEVKREARPAPLLDKSLQLVNILNGGDDSSGLHKILKDGSRVKSCLGEDVGALCSAIDLGAVGSEHVVHWCYVREGSPEHQTGLRIGSACCKDRSESVEKAVVPLLNLMVNRHWDNSSENRWTYVLSTLRRIALGCSASRLLPESLQLLKVFWGLNDSMISSLERLLQADAGDFHTKSKLRLLRICKCFCATDFCWQIGIIVTTLTIVDSILFAILSDGHSAKASLTSLLDSRNSPIAKSQQSLLNLLESWRPGDEWSLFQALGGDFANTDAKLWARAQTLQLCSGLFDFFEIMMCSPPHNLLRLTDDAVPTERKRAAAAEFLLCPEHCLSLFSLRLREKCPTVPSLLNHGAQILRSWGQSSFVAIDFSERSHGQMRTDLSSSGRSRSFATSSNRMFCQQMKAELISRGCSDPAGAKPLRNACVAGLDGSAPLLPDVKPKSKRMEFQNCRLATFKKVHAPHRPLTSDERHRCLAVVATDWAKMNEDQMEQWRLIHQGAVLGRRLPGQPALANGPPATAKSLWHSNAEASPGCPPLPADFVSQQHGLHSSKKERRELSLEDPALKILGPVAVTASSLHPDPNGRDHVFGCYTKKKNVCRAVLSDEDAKDLNILTNKLSDWVSSMGAVEAYKADKLLWLHGEVPGSDPETKVDMIALLVDVRLSPKVQYFARSALKCTPDEIKFAFPCAFPFFISLAKRASRLSDLFKVLDMCTSDELCIDMVKMRMTWELRQLNYSLFDCESLLDMKVPGAGEAIVFNRVAPVPKPSACAELSSIVVFDVRPLSLGAGLAASEGALEQAGGSATPIASGDEADAENFDSLPQDMLDDIQ